jgi:MoxR-like ATPase
MSEYRPDEAGIDQALRLAARTIGAILDEVGKEVIGQERVRQRLIMALIVEGHVLLEGVPGLAKTLSIKTLASTVKAKFQRIQFTPDLLPADLIGTEVFRPQQGTFEVRKGPVFANFVLADEINRAPAKVQSALLETMQEKQVTIGETTLKVPEPFLVLATQNPIEQEGTYPLPEAQIDRFLMKVKVDYPSSAEEKQMLAVVTAPEAMRVHATQVATLEDIAQIRDLAQHIYVDDRVRQYIIDLVGATRRPKEHRLSIEPLIELGASPRAVIALFLCARAEALLRGERYVVPQMVKDVAADVLRHRIMLTYEAEAQGLDTDDIVQMILQGVEVP